MYRVRLNKAFKFFHGGFRPVEYGPGLVENMPGDAAEHAASIPGLVESITPDLDLADERQAPHLSQSVDPHKIEEDPQPEEPQISSRRNRR